MILAYISFCFIKTEADQWDVWGGVGVCAHTTFFCQIIMKSALNWLESKTKIFGAVNHPPHPQNQDSLFNLNTNIRV